MDYIIVQAGGRGTRLKHLTKNKPKALISVKNLPMLFHLFRKYPEKRFVIIADYHKEVLRKYLNSFANIKYQIVDVINGTGTASGVRQALDLIPEGEPFMLIWSDLILPENLKLPLSYEEKNGIPLKDYIGISATFSCRWKYENGVFTEAHSAKQGVAGFFLFTEKKKIEDVPQSGELVRWMQEKKMHFCEFNLEGTEEYGLLEDYKKLDKERCRPFNRIIIDGPVIIKKPIDEQGRMLAAREYAWYEKAHSLDIDILPKIYSINPLCMEKICGKNIYEYNLSFSEKRKILKKLVDSLHEVHQAGTVPTDSFSLKEAYFRKTMNRLSQIENLVPYARERFIRVNGRNCRNIYYYRDQLEKKIENLKCEKFCFIHGDCTFSNLMLREDGSPVLIDPRGYFGYTELYGDVRYDWAKLYYSIVGNYDRFNLKDFRLEIGGEEYIPGSSRGEEAGHLPKGEVRLEIVSNGWEDMENEFFSLTDTDPDEIKLLHAIIWLSLTTYTWQDYDSVCGAFYNGLYYLEEIL